MTELLQQRIPVAQWVDTFVEWLSESLASFFNLIQDGGQTLMDVMINTLSVIPPLVLILLTTVIAFFIFNKKWQMPLFTFLGLLFIYNQNMWGDLINTITLIIVSSLISIVVGVPLGILMAKTDKAQMVITPVLDVMQTMPSFVYLIPAVAFFGIGMVPGVFAAVIFALPPTVRMTNLGIRQVDSEVTEASDSFGGTAWQKLIKVELPLASKSIFAGINQTIMLVLSMVVVASMIGAPGLGQGVLSAVQRSKIGEGFVYGMGVVIIAIIIDRFTQRLNQNNTEKADMKISKRKKWTIGGAATAAIVGLMIMANTSETTASKGTITLAYAEQDDQVVTTSVVAQILEEQGYNVNMTSLDIPVTWEAVANGQADAMLGAWLPMTHGANYEEFEDQLDNLGPSLDKQAQMGYVVPTYMDVDSIEDLTDEADKTIVATEPGAGVTIAGVETADSYPNLADWEVTISSAGAMTTQLERALNQEEEIVITGWTPHWMFSRFDLKFLEDPQATMGGAESILTMARLGLKEDQPEAYRILENFEWELSDIESVMVAVEEGQDPEDAARDWINENPEKIEEWVE